MKNFLIFVGGIHGVGKTDFVRRLAEHYGAQHVTASDLIRTRKSLPVQKRVSDVEGNQDILVLALQDLERTSDVLLLDGHYCLINSTSDIEEVPLRTFQQLSPTTLVVLSNQVEIIRDRLQERDGQSFSEEFIRYYQNFEIECAGKVSVELGIPLEHVVAPTCSDIHNPKWKSLLEVKDASAS